MEAGATSLTPSRLCFASNINVVAHPALVFHKSVPHVLPYSPPPALTRHPPPDEHDSLLPFLQAASIESRVALGPDSGRPIPKLTDHAAAIPGPQSPPPLTSNEQGYSLHAATHIPANDRALRERLCRDPLRNDSQDRFDAATRHRGLPISHPPLAQGRTKLKVAGYCPMVPTPNPALFAATAPPIPSPEGPFGWQLPTIHPMLAPAPHLAPPRSPETAPLERLST